MTTATPTNPTTFKGNDSALLGIVLAVVTFWLFAQTTMNIGPMMAEDVGMPMSVMNIAISLSALFSGMFIVVLGGLGDKFGRVKIVLLGNIFNIIGSLFIAFAFGDAATPMIILGRILQGLAAGSIMPSTMALLKVYWDGPARQRAVSMWSIGSWGGSGLTAIFGGFMASTVLGWRSIFIICAVVSVISILLMRQIPESAPAAGREGKTDWIGIIAMAVGLAALLIVVTQGSSIGWTSMITWGLFAIFLAAFGVFINNELKVDNPFVDFKLFRNTVFTGATISNFLINGTAGALTVSLWVLQGAADMSAATAGYLTAGYAIFIIAFIRVGEKLLQKFGPRKPMIWGTIIVLVSIALLMATNTLVEQYVILAVIAYSLFGLGLAFYATPSTDAALTNLPDDQAGAGSGIYKMASSLGAAFGVAASAAIFTALSETGLDIVGAAVEFSGRQDNLAVREAGMVGLAFNGLMAIAALISITVFIPKGKKAEGEDKPLAAAPQPGAAAAGTRPEKV
ncbi:Quinolone resistance protein NorB [Corynebacterium occultum]|uniref:Quinolone resistance protein NorB n=1 Tax=Corynebacterium occultum TaxID=2675219 RepID=A0A6B8VW60_9CORY|nr:MFS transporter [Corynebacterium occultum]QGU08383.1 Quinolone resistance protein NorB [Corynebacterium occultum]